MFLELRFWCVWLCSWHLKIGLWSGFPVLGIPQIAVGIDVAGGGLRIEFPVVAAEGFEEGETLWNAGVVEKVIEGEFDQAGIAAAATEDFADGGCLGFGGL